jgi:hypothetical protein
LAGLPENKSVGSEPVIELFKGRVAWDGVVEIFDLTGHSKRNAATLGRIWKTTNRKTQPFSKFRP